MVQLLVGVNQKDLCTMCKGQDLPGHVVNTFGLKETVKNTDTK